jgi:hypothetical protein
MAYVARELSGEADRNSGDSKDEKVHGHDKEKHKPKKTKVNK